MLRKIFKKFIWRLESLLIQAPENFERQAKVFGWFGLFSYPIYYLIWLFFAPQTYENLFMRLVASILCIPLIFKDYWPQKLKKFLAIYWYLVLLYCLPSFFTFMLFKNNFSTEWLLNTMSALVWGILLADVFTLSLLFLIGLPLGWYLYYLTTAVPFFPENYGSILITFTAVFLFSGIFARSKEKVQEEKLNAMAAIGGSIAHELRNPLLAINTGLNGVKRYFAALLGGYQKANAHNLLKPEEKIRPDRFEVLLTIVDDLSAEIQYANIMIDMLLLKVNPNLKSAETTICSAFDCIDDAIRRYPFSSPEQANLIEWNMENDNDFNFRGSQLLIVHVFFNLIKNALYFIAEAHKGKISIRTELGASYNRIYFKDTAKGVPAHILPHLFTRFYTKNQTGTGLGLAFCKMVMTGMGGDIICQSELGEFTEFILMFPALNESKYR